MRWAILTGEYPPQPGGVADHTRLVAHGLVACGDEVHVLAPADHAAPADAARTVSATSDGVTVHRLAHGFGPRGLSTLGAALDRLPRPYRLLVQYVPHAFGWSAMNLPFCLWLRARGGRDAVDVMFHEVAFPFRAAQPPRHMLLAGVTRAMARLAARAADRTYVAIPAWEALLPRRTDGRAARWLPVPSNVATCADPARVAMARAAVAPAPETEVVGHFGTFGTSIAPMLDAIVPPLLADERRVGLLIGRGAGRFARALGTRHPALATRLRPADDLGGDALAAHLAACDVLVQPYPDGATSRRGTLMAGLALGVPTVTTSGPLTESLWVESDAVALAPVHAPHAAVALTETLLGDPIRRAALGARGARLYAERFAVAHTIAALRAEAPADAPVADAPMDERRA